jgi:hypothetical protein
VFKLADDADRAGTADKNTYKNYLAASSFLDVTTQFGELPEECDREISRSRLTSALARLKKMNKYAKWRATLIGKALTSGTPIPPPPSDVRAFDFLLLAC